ncbi:MAG: HIT family protein [Thermoanaerobaculia bacterium]
MSCVFCTDPSRAGDVVFEDETCWIILHDDWSPAGHAMVVSRSHVENGSDLDATTWQSFTARWQQAEKAILDATGARRAMILKLGIQVPHLHVHIYPMPADAGRAAVFEAFDGKRQEPRDPALIAKIRTALAT